MDGVKVLVTGGAGFIGSALVRLLADRNADIVILDNLVNGRRENLAGLDPGRCRLAVVDIRDTPVVTAHLEGVDILYHLACLGVRHSIHSPLENHAVNAEATLRLLIAARERNVGRFVYVSSSEVYGTTRVLPMTEDHPTLTKTVYGAAKLAGESYARAFFETYAFPTVIVRPFNAFGPRCHHEGDSGEVVPKFLLRCMADRPLIVFGDGGQTRDFTYVEDTARGILLAGLVDRAVGETINLGSGREIAILDLAREVATVAGKPDAAIEHAPPRPGDVRHLRADATKAKALLAFEPSVGLRQGLVQLRDWYAASGVPLEQLLAQDVVQNWAAPNAR